MDVVWSTRYNTGIQLIDEQHKELFSTVNELRTSVQAGADRQVIEHLLDSLLRASARHFASEERFMGEHGYPDLAQHVAEHAAMLTSLKELQAKFLESHHSMAMMVPTFMEGWFKHHISDGDFGFVTFLKARGLV
ncbi:hemerythrin [Geothrix rubra]|uniref:Hemerythrin n=1 Tax=Geothrix rubra TaxID=2927977 RepID=A0ABQ5Q9U4_9BACT|nr:bacteriohemerythrin [Geothrix rubra]GLH71188.1 hemerythrin [Geothrix rubra]